MWDTPATVVNPRTEKLLATLEHYPREYRAQLVTTAIHGEPEEVFRVAGPSIYPFASAVAMGVMTLFLVFSLYTWSVIAFVVLLFMLIGWHSDTGQFSNPEEEAAFEAEYGVPLRPHGSRAIARWCVILTIVTMATALATMAFSTFYLRLTPPEWPPENIPSPDLVLPGIALALLVISIVPMALAARGVRRDEASPVQWGLLTSVILGVAYLGINLFSYNDLGFNYQTQAFGSIFALLGGFQLLTALIVLIMVGVTLFWFVRSIGNGSSERPSRHQSVTDLALLWYYVVAAGMVTYGLMYVLPYLI